MTQRHLGRCTLHFSEGDELRCITLADPMDCSLFSPGMQVAYKRHPWWRRLLRFLPFARRHDATVTEIDESAGVIHLE